MLIDIEGLEYTKDELITQLQYDFGKITILKDRDGEFIFTNNHRNYEYILHYELNINEEYEIAETEFRTI